ncbi:MAG TPA: hypothetical protein VNT54_08735 [Solirubrobacteraceae bacterium]|nr:hypothetical protein [Solirubrobacteraceae bacterium]
MQPDGSRSQRDRANIYAEPAGTPCAEALLATRVASEVARQLHEAGRELRFSLAPSAARVEVLLCDVDGVVLSRMTPTRALEIATGARLAGGTR